MLWTKVKERDAEFEYTYTLDCKSEFCDEQLYTIIVRTQFGLNKADCERKYRGFDKATRNLVVKTLGNFTPINYEGILEDDYYYIMSQPVYHRDWMS